MSPWGVDYLFGRNTVVRHFPRRSCTDGVLPFGIAVTPSAQKAAWHGIVSCSMYSVRQHGSKRVPPLAVQKEPHPVCTGSPDFHCAITDAGDKVRGYPPHLVHGTSCRKHSIQSQYPCTDTNDSHSNRLDISACEYCDGWTSEHETQRVPLLQHQPNSDYRSRQPSKYLLPVAPRYSDTVQTDLH